MGAGAKAEADAAIEAMVASDSFMMFKCMISQVMELYIVATPDNKKRI